MTPELEAKGIVKQVDGLRIIEQVSLSAPLRKITCVVGMNGAGKTSLFRILAGLDAPSHGAVFFRGSRISPQELRKVCTMVFQKTVTFRGTVYDNVAYGLRVSGFPEEVTRSRVISALERVNLSDEKDRIARRLSSGEQQRVAIARALVLQRPVILFDEPTANLDPTNLAIVEEIIRESATASTVLLSTHNLAQARRLSDYVIHLYRGSVVEAGDPSSFFANPMDEKTRLFIEGELCF